MTIAPMNVNMYKIALKKAYEQKQITKEHYELLLSQLEEIEERRTNDKNDYRAAKRRILQQA